MAISSGTTGSSGITGAPGTTGTPETTGASEATGTLPRRADTTPWLMLAVLLAGQFMAFLDVMITNVALPTIGVSLHASGAELQLVVAAYIVSYAMLLITGARLGDILGRRRMFALGVGVFTLASLVAGLAPDVGVLIGARFVQGAGAAAMVPQIMSVIQLRFTGAARARAVSAYTAVLSVSGVIGQVLGGVLVTADLFGASWRPVFLVNVPIGVAALVLVRRLLPADRPAASRRLDLAGLAIAGPAVCLIALPLMLGHQEGWPGWTFACIGLGCAGWFAFLRVERSLAARGGDPLLSLSVFRAPGLLAGLATVALLMASWGGFLFCFALHLQGGLGESALRAGLTVAPCGTAFGLCGYFWRRLPVGWHGYLTPVGCAIAACGFVALAADLRGGGTGGLALQAALVPTGGFLALAFSPLVHNALVRVPPHQAADASGLFTTVLQLSQAVGIAVFGSVFLTLDSARAAGGVGGVGGVGGMSEISGHAVAVTFALVALTAALGVAGAVPLARTVRGITKG